MECSSRLCLKRWRWECYTSGGRVSLKVRPLLVSHNLPFTDCISPLLPSFFLAFLALPTRSSPIRLDFLYDHQPFDPSLDDGTHDSINTDSLPSLRPSSTIRLWSFRIMGRRRVLPLIVPLPLPPTSPTTFPIPHAYTTPYANPRLAIA